MESRQDFNLKTIDLIVFTIIHLYNYTLKEDKIVNNSVPSDSDIESESKETSSNESTSNIKTSSTADSTCDSSDSNSSTSASDDDTSTSDDDTDLRDGTGEKIRQFLSEYFMDKRGNKKWQWEKLD